MQLFLPCYFVLRIVHDLKIEAEGKMCRFNAHTLQFLPLFSFTFLLCSFFSVVYFFFSILRVQTLALQEDDELIFLPLLVEHLRVQVFALSGL